MRREMMIILFFVVVGSIFGSTATAGDWRLPVGFSYVSGFPEIRDIFMSNLQEEGYYVESVDSLPIGISFQPFYSIKNGFGVGAGIGPLMVIAGDASLLSLPINLDLSYCIFPEKKVSIYFRGGARYNVVSGDYVEGSLPGVFVNIGSEFLKLRRLSFRTEIGYDSSAIEIYDMAKNEIETVQPGNFMASLFVAF